jgi:hypothetical protein
MLKQNYPNGYHISKGADDIYWILNEGEDYKGKLSTDLNKAKAKAEEKIGYVPDVVIWHRRSWEKFTLVKTPVYLEQHVLDYFSNIEKLETAKKIKEAKDKYSYVGDVGDILDLELTITKIFGFDSNYGYCLAHKFKDADNNSLIYFGNSKQLCNNYDSKFKEGDKITITAEIKRHTKDQRDFVFDNGFDQVMKPLTVLSKPKLIK